MKNSPRSQQLEKAHVQQRRPNAAKKKKKNKQTQNLLEENIRQNLHDLGVGKDFFQVTKAPAIQEKNCQIGFHQNQNFLLMKRHH